jgi:hypothetical protein
MKSRHESKNSENCERTKDGPCYEQGNQFHQILTFNRAKCVDDGSRAIEEARGKSDKEEKGSGDICNIFVDIYNIEGFSGKRARLARARRALRQQFDRRLTGNYDVVGVFSSKIRRVLRRL